MANIVYPKQVLISEIAIIIISILSINLISYAQSIEEYFLSSTLKSVIIIGDISISFGIMAGNNFNGAIIIFFLFTIILQLFCYNISMVEVLMPALLCYLLFKVGTIILVKINKLQRLDVKDISKRQDVIECQQKKRSINILLLFISLFIVLCYYLNHMVPLASFMVFAVNAACMVFQIYLMNKSEQTLFKLIANSLSYQLYLYILQNIIFGKIFFDDYGKFIIPTTIMLTAVFFLIRIFIGSKSSKFHNIDQIMFQMIYIFKGDDGDKHYRHNKNHQRTLRVLDKISRQIVLFLYFLSVCTAFYLDQFMYLFASIALLINYPLQQQAQWKPVAYIRQKFNLGFKLRLKLALPIVILVYILISKQNTRKEQLFDTINHCSLINNLQIAYLALIFTAVSISNLFNIQLQHRIFRIVQLICPLIVVAWVLWLQCVHTKLVALGLYVLIFCLQQIRDGRQVKRKGGKRQ